MHTKSCWKAGWLALTVSAALLWGAPAADASTITYDFTVTVETGPLAPATDHGSFSFDSSLVGPNAFYNQTGLLTGFDFTFDGIHYTSATVNTGSLTFDPSGNVNSFLFGTDCVAGICSVKPTADSFSFGANLFANKFVYTTPAGTSSADVFGGSIAFSLEQPTTAAVPEPSSLALLVTAALGLISLRRRGWLALTVAAALLWGTPAADASTITYDFTVTLGAGGGPLAPATINGSFSYDSSLVVPGSGVNQPSLTAFDFTLDGIHYTATTIDASYLFFNATGGLYSLLFTTPGPLNPSGDTFYFAANNDLADSKFQYTTPAGKTIEDIFGGSIAFSLEQPTVAAPEPSSLALLVTAALGLGSLRRRSTRK
jgi:PEP-CTERM motif